MSQADLQFTVGAVPGGQAQRISPVPLRKHVPPFLHKLASDVQALTGREQFLPGT